MIRSPKSGSTDIELDAQDAIEKEFVALIDRAIAAGWTRAQALTAISHLADNSGCEESKVCDDGRHEPSAELPIVSSFD